MAVPALSGDEVATAEALALTCKELDDQVSGLTEEQASRFFQIFSLDSLFRVFSSPALTPEQEASVISVLTKLFGSSTGRVLLPQALPYLAAAVQSPKLALRRLAVQQYSQLLHDGGVVGGQRHPTEQQVHLLSQLLIALKDTHTGVAHSSSLALSRWAALDPRHVELLLSPGPGLELLQQQVAELAVSAEGTLRLRLLSLVADVARSGGTGLLAAVQRTGLLHSLVSRELLEAKQDPLSALSALNTVSDLAECWSRQLGGGAAAQEPGSGSGPGPDLALELCRAVVSALPGLVSEPLLRPGALAAAALLLSEGLQRAEAAEARRRRRRAEAATEAGLERGVDLMSLDEGEAGANGEAEGSSSSIRGLAEPLLQALRDSLDDAGDHGAEDEVAALVAAGKLAGSCAGAELVLGDAAVVGAMLDRALGRASSSPAVRIAALHALAYAAGLDRSYVQHSHGAGAGTGANQAPSGPLDPHAAALSAAAEQALRAGSYRAASSSAGAAAHRSPSEALVAMCSQPLAELAVASFRATSALALRPWFAAELSASPELLLRITDAAAVQGQVLSTWRHAAVMALWASMQAVAQLPGGHPDAAYKPTLAASMAQVQAAVKAGPYTRAYSRSAQDVPQVATL